MDKKKLIGAIIGIIAFGALITGATFAWWTWTSDTANDTVVAFNVVDGSNKLKATLDATQTTFNGLYPTDSCTSTSNGAQMVPITLYYLNNTKLPATISATLTLKTLTPGHSGSLTEAMKASIHWALSTSSTSCTSGALGSGTLEEKTVNDALYTGNLGLANIPASTNTTMQTQQLYLYVWIDGNAMNTGNIGNSVVNDPMQDMQISVTWSGTINNVPVQTP